LSAPPSPSHLANTFKSSRRKSMAPTDAFAQSSVPGTTFRSRTLSHSISAPTFYGSGPAPPPRSFSDSSTLSMFDCVLRRRSHEPTPHSP
jgi:hypothetical protein